MRHRLGQKGKDGENTDDLVQADESQQAQETVELVENKKVFKDDYGKDIVDPDVVGDWAQQYDRVKGKRVKEAKPKQEVSEATKATDLGNYNERDKEPM